MNIFHQNVAQQLPDLHKVIYISPVSHVCLK